jgi:hypothetical protein
MGVTVLCHMVELSGLRIRYSVGPRMVAHVCNPSYLGGVDWENLSLKLAQHVCSPSYAGGRGRRIIA